MYVLMNVGSRIRTGPAGSTYQPLRQIAVQQLSGSRG
jgi:hypothetical protein